MTLLSMSLASSLSAEPSGLAGKNFRYDYSSGQTYRVHFDDKTVTWTGLKGPDKGHESDVYQFARVTPEILFVNWTEADGTFVDTVLNLKDRTVFSSGHLGKERWFDSGLVTSLPDGDSR